VSIRTIDANAWYLEDRLGASQDRYLRKSEKGDICCVKN